MYNKACSIQKLLLYTDRNFGDKAEILYSMKADGFPLKLKK